MSDPIERRPLRTREMPWAGRLAAAVAGTGVTPNTISVLGVVAAILAGACFAATRATTAEVAIRGLWVAGAVGVQLRLIANMLDGMVAIETGRRSAIGELYNEVPDRVADTAVLFGLGWAAGGTPWLGALAAACAIFVAYVRAMGKAAGADQEFCGPLAKPQRMALVTLLGLVMAIIPAGWRGPWWGPDRAWGAVQLVLVVIIVGCLVTAARRLRRIARTLRERAT